MESGWQLTRDLLGIPRPPTALFCTNNVLAVGALLALRQARQRVPEDIALVCFDDIELASLMDPFLTVAVQPAFEMGKRATTLLLDRLTGRRGPTQVREVLPVRLIIRRSCGMATPVDRTELASDGWIGRQWRSGSSSAQARTAEGGAVEAPAPGLKR